MPSRLAVALTAALLLSAAPAYADWCMYVTEGGNTIYYVCLPSPVDPGAELAAFADAYCAHSPAGSFSITDGDGHVLFGIECHGPGSV